MSNSIISWTIIRGALRSKITLSYHCIMFLGFVLSRQCGLIMSVAGFNNCKVSDYKATIWTWTLTRDAWGARSEQTPASCSGLGAREQGQYVAKIVLQDRISDEDMTLKPSLWMYLHKSFTQVEDLSEDDCEYWCPEAVQLPALCKYLTSHKFRDTVSSVQSWSHCVLLVSKSQKWILILFCVQILL